MCFGAVNGRDFNSYGILLPDGDEGIAVPLLGVGSARGSCNPSCYVVTSLEASFMVSTYCFVQLLNVQVGPAHRYVELLAEERHDGIAATYTDMIFDE
jgi:hypothetical protein